MRRPADAGWPRHIDAERLPRDPLELAFPAAHETLVLSERDRRAFFDALVNPPEPNGRLRRAFAEHKRRVGR